MINTKKLIKSYFCYLRDEITGLKTILKDHLNCDVTVQNQMQTALRYHFNLVILILQH